jgi:hypothetical protein
MTEFGQSLREQVLASCGAAPSTVDELLKYGEPPSGEMLALPTAPLADEPHVDAWRHYEEEARGIGAIEALKPHFVQLRFPVEAGMSSHDAYRRATRQGRFEEADDFRPGLALRRPEGIELHVCLTMGGHIPVLTTTERDDFVALVRAFTERNEPVPVPAAMGACLVRGLINWSRIAAYRARWESHHPDAGASQWTEEFRRLAERKELYQDRLVILSRGPYSAVASAEIGLDETDWLARSLIIRREHEFTHYFTYRRFGSIRSHILDELVADFVGLVHACGRYRSDLALRFLGFESSTSCRADGRFMIYRGQPPLSDAAMAVVSCLAVRAARNLEAIDAACLVSPSDLATLGRLTGALFSSSLEELASADAPSLVGARLLRASQANQTNPGGASYGR